MNRNAQAKLHISKYPAFTAAFARHKEAWKGLLPITALENSPDGEEFKRRLKQ